MYCKNCGKKLEDEQKDICPECEATLNTQPFQQGDNIEVIKEVKSSNETNSNNNNTQNTTTNVGYSDKSKIVAGILGILLGSLGIHNFYLGYTGKGVAQLLISVLSCGILTFVSAIWGLVEGIMLLTDSAPVDAEGKILRS